MSDELNQDLVVGLDAGGTRTRAVLASATTGATLGEAAAGPGNALTVALPDLTDHLADAIGLAVPERARGRVVSVAGGFAGAAGRDAREPGRLNALAALTEALRRLGITAPAVGVGSDIEAAFASAPGTPADGLALIAGTGAVATRVAGRRCATTVDGDGWLLGDEGSGFWIGRGAARAALRMADGRGGPTTLARAVGVALGLPAEVLPGAENAERADAAAARWSGEHREAYRRWLLPAAMAQPPVALARLAPLVVEAARDRDPVARAILREAVGHLTDAVRALHPRPGERIVVTGGLAGPGGPLGDPLTARLEELGLRVDRVADGCRGAVALARLSGYGGK